MGTVMLVALGVLLMVGQGHACGGSVTTTTRPPQCTLKCDAGATLDVHCDPDEIARSCQGEEQVEKRREHCWLEADGLEHFRRRERGTRTPTGRCE